MATQFAAGTIDFHRLRVGVKQFKTSVNPYFASIQRNASGTPISIQSRYSIPGYRIQKSIVCILHPFATFPSGFQKFGLTHVTNQNMEIFMFFRTRSFMGSAIHVMLSQGCSDR